MFTEFIGLSREIFEDEDNLTAEGNLKEDAQRQIVAEIRRK